MTTQVVFRAIGNFSHLIGSAHQASVALKGVDDAAKKVDGRKRLGTALLAIGGAIQVGLGLATKAAQAWAGAWTGVLKVIEGTPAQLSKVEGGLRSLARTLPATHEEIAGVAETAGALGVATDDIVAFTKVMINLGETTNLSADEAATSIQKMMFVMQTAPDDVDNLASSLVALGNNGAATEKDIIQMSQRIAGAASVVGLSEADVLGFSDAVTALGDRVQAGGTSIQRVLLEANKAVLGNTAELQVWARTAGQSTEQFAESFKNDAAFAIRDFISGLAEIAERGEDTNAVLSGIGLNDVRVTRTLLNLASAGDYLTNSLTMSREEWDKNTAAIEEAERRYGTAGAKIDIAKNAMRDAAISIGQNFLPIVAKAAEGVASLGTWFATLPGPAQSAISWIVQVGGAALVAAGLFLRFGPAVSRAITWLGGLGGAGGRAVTALGRVGRAAGVAAAALAILFTASKIAENFADAIPTTTQYTQAILDLATVTERLDRANAPDTDLSENFRNRTIENVADARAAIEEMFTLTGTFGASISGLSNAISTVSEPRGFVRFLDETATLWGLLGDSSIDIGVKSLKELDQALVSLVSSGNAHAAGLMLQIFEQAVADTDVSLEDAMHLLPQYTAWLQATGETAEGAALGALAFTEAQQETVKGLSEGASEFLSFSAGLDKMNERAQEWAQGQAEATDDAEDSWEDFYDGFGFHLDEFVADLQAQADAAENWLSNMRLLSGTLSDELFADLADQGVGGAPLVQAIVDDILANEGTLTAELEGTLVRAGRAAVDATSEDIVTYQPVMRAAFAQLGAEGAAAVGAALDAGTPIADIVEKWSLDLGNWHPPGVEIEVDTEQSEAEFDSLVERIQTAPDGEIVVSAEVADAIADVETAILVRENANGEATITLYVDGVPSAVGDLETAKGIAEDLGSTNPVIIVETNGVPASVASLDDLGVLAVGVGQVNPTISVSSTGVPEADAALAELRERAWVVESSDPTISVSSTGVPEANDALWGVRDRAEEVERINPTITVSSTGTEGADRALWGSWRWARAVEESDPTVSVATAGTGDANRLLGGVRSTASVLDRTDPRVSVSTSGTSAAARNLYGVRDAANAIPLTRTVSIRTKVFGPAFPKNSALGGPIGYDDGGAVFGPGTGTSDSVVADGPLGRAMYRLSNGEHVWTASEVSAAGGHDSVKRLRDAALAGAFAKASGGPVEATLGGLPGRRRAARGGDKGAVVIETLTVNNPRPERASESIAASLRRAAYVGEVRD